LLALPSNMRPGQLSVLAGSASRQLGGEIAALLKAPAVAYRCERFPDGEAQVDLEDSVRGHDVYVVQSTSPPVDAHLVELVLIADACRRAGAARLTGVIPYFGYARQERRSDRRSLGARVAADIVTTGGFDRLMLIDAHTPALEGFFAAPIDHLTAVPLLADAARPSIGDHAVVVAPDLGAVKLAREYSRLLKAPMAFVHKTRVSGHQVEAHAVIGDVRDRTPLVIDDMLSTGGTVKASLEAVRRAGAIEPAMVVVTHALMVGSAREIVRTESIARLIAGNTVPVDAGDLPITVTSVAPLIAAAIGRDHGDQSLAELRARP
jgi:ribose-phosphate pyrophosphokinase